jgi:hypothetical protein
MDKEQAERALAIIRGVIDHTRDDLIARNWGVIWMTHAFINLAAASCGAYIQRQGWPVYWYGAPLLAATVLNVVTVLGLVGRDQGVRSYVEWQLWGIWIAFLVFTMFVLGVLHVAGAKGELFAPLFAANCGIAFASMGLVFYRRFLLAAAMFLLVMLAAARLPEYQWWIVGGAWWLAMFVPGFYAHREKKQRERDERRTRIL